MIKFLRPPIFEDEYQTYQAFLLYIVSMLLSVGAVYLIIYSIIYPSTFPTYIFVALFLICWQAILMFLNYKKKTRLGAWLYLIIGWIVLSVMLFREGGISSPNYAFYFSYIIIAGVLIDWRAGIILGITSIITGIIFLAAKTHYLLPDAFIKPDEKSIFFTYSLIIIIIVTLQSVASYTVFKSLRNARSENDQRKKTEHLLKIQNEESLTLNAELSDSYERLREFNAQLEKAKARAEESDLLKSAFIANMSHEIRTPMNAIVGFSQLLDTNELSDEKRKRYIGLINKRCYDLLTIINDIFDISKLETNQVEIFSEKGDLNQLLEDICQEFQVNDEFNEQEPIEIRVGSLPEKDQSNIIGDFKRIKQILLNLIGNARKFTNQGYIEFGCKIIDQVFIQFYVEDSGIGIPTEHHKIIFDRFRQAEEKHLSKAHGGTGLGLSISKGLVELMHGKIWVESEVNKGSTFYFKIPYVPAEVKSHRNIQQKVSAHNWKGKKILIVEDDLFNMEYFKKALSPTMADLYMAKSGAEARNLFKLVEMNLVLMDIRLPDTNGYELTREFLRLKPSVQIIVQTAYAGEDDRKKAIDAGCSEVITKPIQLQKLLLLIEELIG